MPYFDIVNSWKFKAFHEPGNLLGPNSEQINLLGTATMPVVPQETPLFEDVQLHSYNHL